MEQSGPAVHLSARLRHLRHYRLLANTFATLLAFAAVLLLIRWISPWIFSVLVYVWTVDAILLAALVVPWMLVSSAFARGKLMCPSCDAPFTSRFHLWVPKTCQKCGCDITAGASASDR